MISRWQPRLEELLPVSFENRFQAQSPRKVSWHSSIKQKTCGSVSLGALYLSCEIRVEIVAVRDRYCGFRIFAGADANVFAVSGSTLTEFQYGKQDGTLDKTTL